MADVGDEEPEPCELLAVAVVVTPDVALSVMAAGCDGGGGLEVLSRCSAAIGLGPNSPSGRTRYC